MNGTYAPVGEPNNYFDPAFCGGAVRPPSEYGNYDSYVDVPVSDIIEFGFQFAFLSPRFLVSVNISKTTSGFTVTWTEQLGGLGFPYRSAAIVNLAMPYFDARALSKPPTPATQACQSPFRETLLL